MPPTAVRLAPATHAAIQDAARAAWPREIVGVLGGGRDGDDLFVCWFQAMATAGCDEDRFVVAPADFARAEAEVRARGFSWLGFVHSHPRGSAAPSLQDRRELWPHCLQLILAATPSSPPRFGAYWRDGATFADLELHTPTVAGSR